MWTCFVWYYNYYFSFLEVTSWLQFSVIFSEVITTSLHLPWRYFSSLCYMLPSKRGISFFFWTLILLLLRVYILIFILLSVDMCVHMFNYAVDLGQRPMKLLWFFFHQLVSFSFSIQYHYCYFPVILEHQCQPFINSKHLACQVIHLKEKN